MTKMQILLDDEKIKRERKLSAAKMQAFIDSVFIDRCRLAKDADGFYTGTGDSGDLMRFGQANYLLSNQPWFLDNVKCWMFYSNDDTDDPDEYVVEDVKGYYLDKRQVIA
jgi:hypothetical protein